VKNIHAKGKPAEEKRPGEDVLSRPDILNG
jgi:hypothetical protein